MSDPLSNATAENAATEPAPALREKILAEVNDNLQDFLGRPVIRDHPYLQGLAQTYARRYADILIYLGEHNDRHRRKRAEFHALGKHATDAQKQEWQKEEYIHHEALARTNANAAAMNEEAIELFSQQKEHLAEYIREFLNTPEEGKKKLRARWHKTLDPENEEHLHEAAERMVGAVIRCAAVTVRKHYSPVWVTDYVDAAPAHEYLLKLQTNKALAEKYQRHIDALDEELASVFERPVIRDNPQVQERLREYAKLYLDTLIYLGEHNAEYTKRVTTPGQIYKARIELPSDPQQRAELSDKDLANIKEERLHTVAVARAQAHLVELNEDIIHEFSQQGDLMAQYITGWLNTPEAKSRLVLGKPKPDLNPDDLIDREKAAEKLAGSVIRCAIDVASDQYNGLWVKHETKSRVAYHELVGKQGRIARAEKREREGAETPVGRTH